MTGEIQQDAILTWMQEVAPYGIFTTDADLRIRTWNRWLVNHSGLGTNEVVGRLLVEVFPDIHARRLDDYLRHALAGEISVLSTALHKHLLPMPVKLRGYDVAQMLQTVRIAPLTREKEIVGTITTIEDVTQRECQASVLRRQQEHDRLHTLALALLLQAEDPLRVTSELFQHIAAPLKLDAYIQYLLSVDGTELHLNASGGLTPEMRRTMSRLRLGEGPGGQAAELRKPVVLGQLQSRSDAASQPVRRIGLRSCAAFPLVIGERLLGTLVFGSYQQDEIAPEDHEFLGTIAQYLAIAIDRAQRESALLQARESLSEHAGSLEAKVRERTARLHETIVQLESFTYTVAHDLRAPIRALKGYSAILLDDFAANIPPDGAAMLRRIHRAGERLDALTRDLLEFSRLARTDVQLSVVDVDEVVHDIMHATPALQNGVLTVCGPLPPVRAQRMYLQQCLSNLLDNAVKFAAAGVEPRITIWAETHERAAEPVQRPVAVAAWPCETLGAADLAATSVPPVTGSGVSFPATTGRRVRIWVEDNGIGIAPEAHQRIFGIFERAGGVEHVEGTGIGLAIVARAVQQMGAACGVESSVGRGSRFWLEFAAGD